MKKIVYFSVLMVVVLGLTKSGFSDTQSQFPAVNLESSLNTDTHSSIGNDGSKSVFVNIIPDTVCVFLNETFSFEGLIEASGYNSIQWLNVIGYGFFLDETLLEAEYQPHPFDVLLDGVVLMVYVFGETEMAFDQVILKVVGVSAGEPASVCAGQVFQTMAEVSLYESLLWTSSGDGFFDDATALSTFYTPGVDDIASGQVQLTLTATAGPPCNITGSATVDLTIVSPPDLIVDIEDSEVELGQAIILSIVANNATGYQWYGPQGLIDGAVMPDLEIWEATFENSGQYYCEFYNDCGAQVSSTITLNVYQQQTITLPVGWSGISSWIVPYETEVENLFEPVSSDLVVLQNFSGVFMPGHMNTLILWDSQSGYQVKMNNPVEIIFKGQPNPNTVVNLNAGWNYLPVISACDVDVASVFGGKETVVQIKDIAGWQTYWPAQNVTSLDTLHPGKAYLIFVTGETTISFPSCE